MAGEHAPILHLLALVEKRRGATEEARAAFERALLLDPVNIEITTNAGNFYRSLGDYPRALECYDRALTLNDQSLTALLGRAFCLGALGRVDEARAEYHTAAGNYPSDHRPWSGLGALERQHGDLAAAANAFDESVTRAPSAAVPAHGRARVALERGERDAHQRFHDVERLLPSDPEVALGAAEAWVPVDQTHAIERLEQVASRFPDWPEPRSALARLKWERGDDHAFAAALEAGVSDHPHNPGMWNALVAAYGGVDRHIAASAAASRAHAATGDDRFLLLGAAHASEAGEMDRADTLFEQLRGLPGAELGEARHCLKKGDVDRADALLDAAREALPDDVAVWAWTGLVWRLKEDPRTNWLYQLDQLVSVQSIAATEAELDQIAGEISRLHHASSFPIGQSLRGGTQTRGRLFDHVNQSAQTLRRLLNARVQAHWANLPQEDACHPLLRHRSKLPKFAGSWSVHLKNNGFHVPHFHPRGLMSSACYLRLPDGNGTQDGWLELGRPPPDLGLHLPPLLQIEPRVGALVLFPSYLFHGTVPFNQGERLSVAFDVAV